MRSHFFKTLLFIFTSLVLFSDKWAFSYPGFVGYGYSTCTSCHYNPYGNGPLTDYGRALSANTLSQKPFFLPNSVTDDELGETSGFFGKHEILPDWLRFSGDYRGLYLITNLQNDLPKKNFITMQAEGSLILQFNENQTYGVGTLGYIPVSDTLSLKSGEKVSILISREHYIAHHLTDSLSFYLGMMDNIYGTKIPDHTAYSRSQTFVAQNDQTHGLLGRYVYSDFELGVQGVLGNIFQDSKIRQTGVALRFDYDPLEYTRIGFSTSMTSSDFRSRRLFGIHASTAMGYGNGLLAEVGMIDDQLKGTPIKRGGYALAQGLHKITRGLHFLTTVEYYKQNFNAKTPYFLRITPGIQYFPMQRVEIRLEAQGTLTTTDRILSTESFHLLNQIHIWL